MNAKKFAIALVLVASAGLANAQTFFGGGFAINDLSANSGTIDVLGATTSITGIDVTIYGLSHTFFFDLSCYLTAPNGDVITLFDNVLTGAALNGTYVFSDSASAVVSASDLAGGTFLAQGGSLAGAFGGDNANGNWTLNIDDQGFPDIGGIQGWDITIRPVPAPGAAALLGLGGLIMGRRRRA